MSYITVTPSVQDFMLIFYGLNVPKSFAVLLTALVYYMFQGIMNVAAVSIMVGYKNSATELVSLVKKKKDATKS